MSKRVGMDAGCRGLQRTSKKKTMALLMAAAATAAPRRYHHYHRCRSVDASRGSKELSGKRTKEKGGTSLAGWLAGRQAGRRASGWMADKGKSEENGRKTSPLDNLIMGWGEWPTLCESCEKEATTRLKTQTIRLQRQRCRSVRNEGKSTLFRRPPSRFRSKVRDMLVKAVRENELS